MPEKKPVDDRSDYSRSFFEALQKPLRDDLSGEENYRIATSCKHMKARGPSPGEKLLRPIAPARPVRRRGQVQPTSDNRREQAGQGLQRAELTHRHFPTRRSLSESLQRATSQVDLAETSFVPPRPSALRLDRLEKSIRKACCQVESGPRTMRKRSSREQQQPAESDRPHRVN